MSSIEGYYDEDPAREWERLERHRTEFAVTLRALAAHLPPPPASIIDIGGGPGRYAIALTQQGYRVTLVDLAAQNLAFAQEKAREAGVEIAAYVHADARDLAQFADDTFDAALLLGMYGYGLSTTSTIIRMTVGDASMMPQSDVTALTVTRQRACSSSCGTPPITSKRL